MDIKTETFLSSVVVTVNNFCLLLGVMVIFVYVNTECGFGGQFVWSVCMAYAFNEWKGLSALKLEQ